MDGTMIGLGIALFGFFVGAGLVSLGRDVARAVKSFADEIRYYTRVVGHFEIPPAPPPPPVDPRAKKMEDWLRNQPMMGEDEKDNLLAIYEGVAGIRPAAEYDVKAWRARLAAIGAPLPS